MNEIFLRMWNTNLRSMELYYKLKRRKRIIISIKSKTIEMAALINFLNSENIIPIIRIANRIFPAKGNPSIKNIILSKNSKVA